VARDFRRFRSPGAGGGGMTTIEILVHVILLLPVCALFVPRVGGRR
jgi:hypothetical protein